MIFKRTDIVIWRTRSSTEPIRIGQIRYHPTKDGCRDLFMYMDVVSLCGKSCGDVFTPHFHQLKKLEGVEFTLAVPYWDSANKSEYNFENGLVAKIQCALYFDQKNIKGNKYRVLCKGEIFTISHQDLVNHGVKWLF